MNIVVNNENYDLPENAALDRVIEELQISETNGIALALNETIIPHSEWNKTTLTDGDKIIIIGAVAGG
jgi:sulfur carrier protein